MVGLACWVLHGHFEPVHMFTLGKYDEKTWFLEIIWLCIFIKVIQEIKKCAKNRYQTSPFWTTYYQLIWISYIKIQGINVKCWQDFLVLTYMINIPWTTSGFFTMSRNIFFSWIRPGSWAVFPFFVSFNRGPTSGPTTRLNSCIVSSHFGFFPKPDAKL